MARVADQTNNNKYSNKITYSAAQARSTVITNIDKYSMQTFWGIRIYFELIYLYFQLENKFLKLIVINFLKTSYTA